MSEQVATVSKLRLGTRLGVQSDSGSRLVNGAIRIQLGIGATES